MAKGIIGELVCDCGSNLCKVCNPPCCDCVKRSQTSQFSAESTLLSGKCPDCQGVISEIPLEHQSYGKRVLCLDCKIFADGNTWGHAYSEFLKDLNT